MYNAFGDTGMSDLSFAQKLRMSLMGSSEPNADVTKGLQGAAGMVGGVMGGPQTKPGPGSASAKPVGPAAPGKFDPSTIGNAVSAIQGGGLGAGKSPFSAAPGGPGGKLTQPGAMPKRQLY